MTKRTDAFNLALETQVTPLLEALGYTFDRSRTFRKIDYSNETASIVNFQLGQRSSEGKFTVNLGFYYKNDIADVSPKKAFPYHCAQSAQIRIGLLLPPKISALKDTYLLSIFFGSNDKWWKFYSEQEKTDRQLAKVTSLLIEHGVPWLSQQQKS